MLKTITNLNCLLRAFRLNRIIVDDKIKGNIDIFYKSPWSVCILSIVNAFFHPREARKTFPIVILKMSFVGIINLLGVA